MAGEMLKALSVLRDDLSSSPSIHIEPNNLCNSSSRRFVYLQKLGFFIIIIIVVCLPIE